MESSSIKQTAGVDIVVANRAAIRTVRWATAGWCMALIAGGVAVNTISNVRKSAAGPVGAWTVIHWQVDILGVMALVLALATLPFGLFYGRGVAARMKIAPQARVVHMTISVAALITIVLHILALQAGIVVSLGALGELFVPFVSGADMRFPYPLAAGIVAFWVNVLFGLSYFARKAIGGVRRWRLLHKVVLLGLFLGAVHAVYLSERVSGWG